MKPLTVDDIQNLHEYELARAAFRSRVIEIKGRRRVPLGPLMTLVFENRDTVRFQVQEMLRVERIVQPDKVLHEIETYNELVPGPGEIAATLFIEITDPARVQPILDGFIGLDEPGRLVLRIAGTAYPAVFAAVAGLRAPHRRPRRLRPAAPARPSGGLPSALLLEGPVDAARARAALRSAPRDWIVESARHVRLGGPSLAALAREGVAWSALEPVELLAVYAPESPRGDLGLPPGTPIWIRPGPGRRR